MSNPEAKKTTDTTFHVERREFGKMALGGAAFLAAASSSSATLRPIPPGIKIGTGGGSPTPENMLYLKQLGVTWVSLRRFARNGHCRGLRRGIARAVGSRRLQGL